MLFPKKPARKVTKVFIHCSASDNPKHDDVAVMKKWHTSPDPNDPSKPWSDVGYHFFIKKDGTLQPGRPLEKTPSAQGGHNTGTIAICVHGLKKENFTTAQFQTLQMLCQEIDIAYGRQITFHGHCEVSAKACPVFDYKRLLNLDMLGHMQYPYVAATHRDSTKPTS